jgi:hypothetical protein
MSDSERVMSDEDEEQYQSEGSSMEEENVGNEFMPGKKLTIQKVESVCYVRKTMILDVQLMCFRMRIIRWGMS